MTALLFDTETTGVKEPQIIEAAWLHINDPLNLNVISTFEQRYKPSKVIDLGALAVHHILDEELADCPPHTDFKLPDGVQYLIGHNVDFDWEVASKPEVKRICTLALARHFYPDLDAHNQSALVYLIDRENARDRLKNAHSALADIWNCYAVLANLIARAGKPGTWEALWKISEKARIPTKMTFGKHKGTAISKIPGDYKSWLLRQPDVDPYLAKALRGEAA